jgi:NAD(P)-dependent dehydrogenase (short-subunit alcohol dehydrogenase family)
VADECLGVNFDSFEENDGADPARARLLFNRTYERNVTATQVFTATFIPLLLESSSPRIIFLTSGLSTLHGAHESFLSKVSGSIPKGWPKTGFSTTVAYRSSKTALNMVMLSWYQLLKEDGVRVWSVNPGFLATGLGGNPELLKKAGAGDPATGGELILKVIEGERDGDVGRVVIQDGVQEW